MLIYSYTKNIRRAQHDQNNNLSHLLKGIGIPPTHSPYLRIHMLYADRRRFFHSLKTEQASCRINLQAKLRLLKDITVDTYVPAPS